ncbi:hypothetical protein GQ457_04G018850 [Hibiscus cannabinus]
MLILYKLKEGEDPMIVPHFHVDFCDYVHEVPLGFMSEKVATVLGDFTGSFLEYDSMAVSLVRSDDTPRGAVEIQYDDPSKDLWTKIHIREEEMRKAYIDFLDKLQKSTTQNFTNT